MNVYISRLRFKKLLRVFCPVFSPARKYIFSSTFRISEGFDFMRGVIRAVTFRWFLLSREFHALEPKGAHSGDNVVEEL